MTEPLTADQQEALRQTLVERLAELQGMDALSEEDRKPVELDQQSVGRLSRVDAMQRQAMAFASQARRQHEARMINAALGRIAEGEFGYCGGCGEPIPLARLRLDATIATCIDCAR
ncbi:MAG: TraR/DksA C4-type zinc finger protein [Brevundimonas sp.]|uniref:TraR/DksA family transcriptional regulator n=1 Tax=Brevundimonas sp. TaxID=1871086 RepID=UPI0027369D57|nr:TraR/DksA C4-type zinc finger protein [Brevundimonas sp.]MDP3370280.1 TraR/DksA C4-type zinc finger protein [Brevundimonas sp.]MDP3657891.1 TraR/DksA C4-type zinc finger protein [Brevundimonas sp.]MDZ4111339.1 TraR/DksA C4-type zinc finger protein [Brevundimonas sp.]